MTSPLHEFVKLHRAQLSSVQNGVRIVHQSELIRVTPRKNTLDGYIAQKAPTFYRPLDSFIDDLKQGFPLSTFKETLARIPQEGTFQSSHFGEIAACLFAEEILGLRKLYSKLSLLSAENSNAYKMDLLLYDNSGPEVEFVLGEVKSSPKSLADGDPPNHHKSCYASLFNSLREYSDLDQEFDLAAIKDRLGQVPQTDRARLLDALRPYGRKKVRYAGFVLIDSATRRDGEAELLATRKSVRSFDVDLVGIEDFGVVSLAVFKRLQSVLDALRTACSP